MPAEYEAIRDSYLKHGISEKDAKAFAAATYNKRHPGHPMRPEHRRKKRIVPKPDRHGYY